MHAADHRAVFEREFGASVTRRIRGIRDAVLGRGIDDAIPQLHRDTGFTHHVQRARDAALEHDLANGCSTMRLGALGVARFAVDAEREPGHQRAIAQHQRAFLIVRRGGQVQRAA